jgi:phenylalanyl-tRNA synthetase beta subunit
VSKSTPVGDIVSSIKELQINEIKRVSVFDVYESAEIGDQNKAVGFEIVLHSDNSTLSDGDILSISSSIIEVVAKRYGGVLR